MLKLTLEKLRIYDCRYKKLFRREHVVKTVFGHKPANRTELKYQLLLPILSLYC